MRKIFIALVINLILSSFAIAQISKPERSDYKEMQNQASQPANPAAGKMRWYFDNTGAMKTINSAGTIITLGAVNWGSPGIIGNVAPKAATFTDVTIDAQGVFPNGNFGTLTLHPNSAGDTLSVDLSYWGSTGRAFMSVNTSGTLGFIVDNTGQVRATSYAGNDLSTIIDSSNNATFNSLTVGSLAGILQGTAGVVSGSATTTDLPEGTHLYYTTARFQTDLGNAFTQFTGPTTATKTFTLPDLSSTILTNNTSVGTFPTLNQNTTGYASALKSATTTIDVSAATAPTANQVLSATDSTHATWVTLSSSGASLSTANTWTTAGAASTPAELFNGLPYSAGTATSNKALVLFEPSGATAATDWSTHGTFLGYNSQTGFTGDFLNAHINGAASVFKVDNTGSITQTSAYFGTWGANSGFGEIGRTKDATGTTYSMIMDGTSTYINAPTGGIIAFRNANSDIANISSTGLTVGNITLVGGTGALGAVTGTFSGAMVFNAAGAASTPGVKITGLPFVGTGTNSFPQLLFQNSGASAVTTWNNNANSGTYIGINTNTGFTGNFADWRINGGAQVFKFAYDGTFASTGTITGTGLFISSFGGSLGVSGSTRLVVNNGSIVTTAGQLDYAVNAVGNSGASQTINFNSGNVVTMTLTANCTLTFSNPVAGSIYRFYLTQGGVGSFTITWPAAVKGSGGTLPTLTTTAGKIDIVELRYDGTNYYLTSSLNY